MSLLVTKAFSIRLVSNTSTQTTTPPSLWYKKVVVSFLLTKSIFIGGSGCKKDIPTENVSHFFHHKISFVTKISVNQNFRPNFNTDLILICNDFNNLLLMSLLKAVNDCQMEHILFCLFQRSFEQIKQLVISLKQVVGTLVWNNLSFFLGYSVWLFQNSLLRFFFLKECVFGSFYWENLFSILLKTKRVLLFLGFWFYSKDNALVCFIKDMFNNNLQTFFN